MEKKKYYSVPSYSVSSIHGLQVSHGVPVMLHKHHSICSSQIQTQPTHMGSEAAEHLWMGHYWTCRRKIKPIWWPKFDLPMRLNSSRVVCVAVSPRDYSVSEAQPERFHPAWGRWLWQLGFEQILLHDVPACSSAGRRSRTRCWATTSLCAAIRCSSRTPVHSPNHSYREQQK